MGLYKKVISKASLSEKMQDATVSLANLSSRAASKSKTDPVPNPDVWHRLIEHYKHLHSILFFGCEKHFEFKIYGKSLLGFEV